MAESNLPDIELVRKVLDYDPATGDLYWKRRHSKLFQEGTPRKAAWRANRWNGRLAGKRAGTHGKDGYVRIAVLGTKLLAHRLAWGIVHGRWPTELDHINGNRCDNRLANLREVTRRENAMNARRRSDNKAGIAGVQQVPNGWMATIKSDGRRYYLGCYDTRADAATARRAAQRILGFHANHGRE